MDKEINIKEAILNNKMGIIRDWLKKNVFAYGSLMDPNDWIIKCTNEKLNTKYYLDYLENKYRKIYNI